MDKETKTAVEYLGAVLVGDQWVYYDDADGQWYASDESDIDALGAALLAGEPDAYSLWCADTDAVRARDPRDGGGC